MPHMMTSASCVMLLMGVWWGIVCPSDGFSGVAVMRKSPSLVQHRHCRSQAGLARPSLGKPSACSRASVHCGALCGKMCMSAAEPGRSGDPVIVTVSSCRDTTLRSLPTGDVRLQVAACESSGESMQDTCRWRASNRRGKERGRLASLAAAILMFGSPAADSKKFPPPAGFSPSPGLEVSKPQQEEREFHPRLAFAPSPDAPRDAPRETKSQQWRYSEFFEACKRRRVERVIFSSDLKRLVAVDVNGQRHLIAALPKDQDLLPTLVRYNVDIQVLPHEAERGDRGVTLLTVVFISSVILLRLAIMPAVDEGGGPASSIAKSGAKIRIEPVGDVSFADVMGVDGAKRELEEVVQFLREPHLFTQLGAVIPRGVILEGPPGTGKTLLARAVAGEAGVAFFSISGSEFVEMFVGVGAARVRDLFSQARARAPSIVFIDEIDAVGRQRGSGVAGGNDEREQTLNQILTEMDGFEGNTGVIVIAATNRADVLDPALLRPGRFDRRVVVDLPDFDGRVAILGVHAKGKPLEPAVDLGNIARRCTGFSGAALANLLNEAAIFAVRHNKTSIGKDDVADALDRIMLGPEKKGGSVAASPRLRELVAFHEAGHALVGALTPDFDQVVKVTIVPRGNAGGLTIFAPQENRAAEGLYTRQYLESQMCVGMGGRVAEELAFGTAEVTTGASNDLEQVTRTARAMVTRFGMSPMIGPVTVQQSEESVNPFLGGAVGRPRAGSSSHTQEMVDREISRLVMRAYERAKEILYKNRGVLDAVAERLVDRESISAEELQAIIDASEVTMGEYE